MASGYRIASGVDLDDVFDPYVEGSKPGNTGYRTADGVDLANRYAPLTYGTQAAATGYRIASGADVNTLWAKKGTAGYLLSDPGFPAVIQDTITGTSGSVYLTLLRDGTWSTSEGWTGKWYGTPQPTIGDGYEVLATVTGGGPGSVTNDASTWVSLSSARTVRLDVPTRITTSRSVTIEIRKLGGAVGSTGTTTLMITFDG